VDRVEPRDPFGSYLRRMTAAGFRPSSVLGQNFLLDPSLHRWIAEQAALGPQDDVVEVGAGLGFLTRELAARARCVVAVEIDRRLCALARDDLAACPNVRWVVGDALGGPDGSLLPEIAGAVVEAHARTARCLVVANLPYAVSGPLLAGLGALPELPDGAVVLVQKELAGRLAAAPHTPDYGGLSALLQALFTVRVLRDVPPQVFRPRPKVMSSIVRLERRSDGPMELGPAAARRSFGRFVRKLFQQRRKALRNTLPAAARSIGRLPPACGEDLLRARAEHLAPDEIVTIWRDCVATDAGGS